MVKAFYTYIMLYLYTIMLYIPSHTVSSQRCTITILDPRNVSIYDPYRLVLLPSLNADIRVSEQWIFPDLQFTCYGQVTKWIFTGVPGQTAISCRVEIEIWRLRTSSNSSTIIYDQIRSTTEKRFSDIIITQDIMQDGLVFTYVLASPMVVEPGDIVGVVLQRSCINYYDILGLSNISRNGSTHNSYGQSGLGSEFDLRNATSERDFIPLIEALVGELTVII